MTIVLLIAAAVALAWPWLKERAAEIDWKAVDVRHVAAAILGLAAALTYVNRDQAAPPPAPPEPAGFSLRGAFVGPDASADAATTAALFDELASEIEWDSMQPEPLLKTGVAFDELRRRARLILCRGISLGDKHPRARESIKSYLDRTAGTSGGPLTPEQRSRWASAFRDVGRAAADASR